MLITLCSYSRSTSYPFRRHFSLIYPTFTTCFPSLISEGGTDPYTVKNPPMGAFGFETITTRSSSKIYLDDLSAGMVVSNHSISFISSCTDYSRVIKSSGSVACLPNLICLPCATKWDRSSTSRLTVVFCMVFRLHAYPSYFATRAGSMLNLPGSSGSGNVRTSTFVYTFASLSSYNS